MPSKHENLNNNFLKNDNTFKLFFFAILLRINSLEKSIINLKESLESKKEKILNENNITDKNNINKEYIDKDLIGMSYPDINFNELKDKINKTI